MNRRINAILKSALAFVLAACMLCGCESYTDFLDEAAMSDVTQEDEEETQDAAESEETTGEEETAGEESGTVDTTAEDAAVEETTETDELSAFESAETAYGEGTYYIFASREDHYTSTYDGSEQYFLSEQAIYFQDGELVWHVYEISDYGKGSCGVDPQSGWESPYSVQMCEFYLMTVEQVIASLEEDGFTIVTAQTEWRYDEYDY